jgi:homoserine kinase
MKARAPASSANLGPGFDTLALALALYVEVSVEPAERLEVVTSGCGSELPSDRNHLAAKVAARVAGHDRLRIEVRSEIPVGRGLGSSAALAVAAAAAAGAEDPFAVGAHIDGHPENAAAAAMGGLVTAATVDGRPLARRLSLDPELEFVVVVPDRQLLTSEARAALPDQVPRTDAEFNLGRMGLLIAGFANMHELVPEAGEDRLHQDARATLFPEAPALLSGLRGAGALVSCWSGAGPSLLAVCAPGSSEQVAGAAKQLLEDMRITGNAWVLEPDLGGVTVSRGTSG